MLAICEKQHKSKACINVRSCAETFANNNKNREFTGTKTICHMLAFVVKQPASLSNETGHYKSIKIDDWKASRQVCC